MSENVDTQEERLSVRDVFGRTAEWQVRYAQSPTMSQAGLVSGRITSNTGVIAMKRWVPADLARHDAAACDELEREVMAGVRLADRYPADRYPAELVRLIGYNLDDVEPFVIVAPVHGNPIDDSGQLSPDARESFEVSLLRGLVHLAEAGVTHGNIAPSTVYWDGTGVQIRDFGQATVTTEDGKAVGGVDVWAAGSLILRAATGRTGLAAVEGRGQALRDLLDGVFDDDPDARPSADTLLGRLGVTVRVPAEDLAGWQRFEEGRVRFDQTLREKWPRPQVIPPPAPPVRRRRWGFGAGR